MNPAIEEEVAPLVTVSDINLIDQIIDNLIYQRSHLSYSSLSAFGESPSDFIDYKLRKKLPTPAMAYGSMVHCLVLEPGDFEKRYLAFDDTDFCEQLIKDGAKSPRATNKYKDWLKVQESQLNGRIMVSPVEYRHALIVANKVKYNRASREVLDKCPRRELSVEWEHKLFLHKGFIDLDGDHIIADLKTCADANPKKFQREIVYMDYHMQAAMYLKAQDLEIGDKLFAWIAVDKKGGVSVHYADKRLLEAGMERYDMLLDKFNECIITERWDCSYDFWSPLWNGTYLAEKPGWMY